MDRAYTNLLNHLQRPSPQISRQTVFSTVPHYLSTLPLPHPTQLTAFVISSSLWQIHSAETLWSLANAFRSALHLKKANLQKETRGWFATSLERSLGQWVRGVANGATRGDPQLRIALFGGLLFGIDDLAQEEIRVGMREKIESYIVIACADVMETLSTALDAWNTEFTTKGSDISQDVNEISFLFMASKILPMVASSKFDVLDVSVLIQLSRNGILKCFLDGTFLNDLTSSTTREHNGQIKISSESSITRTIRSIDSNPLFKTAGPLAQLLARGLSHIADRRHPDAWRAFQDTSEALENMAARTKGDWIPSELESVTSEREIDVQTHEQSTEIWSILKTLLFTHVLVSQAILSEIIYMQPLQMISSELTSSSIARSILRTLYHLSFISFHFGGLTSAGGGFKELKRLFYMALDIVANGSDVNASNSFVEEILASEGNSQLGATHPCRQAGTTYVLTIAEQLVPVLTESTLEQAVIPFCIPYLDDPQYRETYESAHSVFLSILADYSKRGNPKISSVRPTLPEKLVPFYINSLLENSSAGRLSRAQLKLAYSNLVRCAASGGDDALAWLCVEALLSRIKASNADVPEVMKLHITLVSLISCVPLSQLLRELEEVEKLLDAAHGEDRKLLAEAVLEEITSRVGDREREVALTWWSNVAPRYALRED